MTKKDVTPQIEEQLTKLGKRINGTKGVAAINALAHRTKSDPSAAQFNLGDEVYVDENANNVFISSFNGNESAGVIVAVKTAAGTTQAKSLYFSSLDREVMQYDESGNPTGVPVAAKNESSRVFDDVKACCNDGEIYNLIKGKSLKVVEIKSATAARFDRAGNIVGTRNRNIPVFDWA